MRVCGWTVMVWLGWSGRLGEACAATAAPDEPAMSTSGSTTSSSSSTASGTTAVTVSFNGSTSKSPATDDPTSAAQSTLSAAEASSSTQTSAERRLQNTEDREPDAPQACSTSCTQLTVQRSNENARPVNQTAVADAQDGCPGFQVACSGNSESSAVIFTWYRGGTDVGSTFGTGSVTATVVCTSGNVLTLEGTAVDAVECISA